MNETGIVLGFYRSEPAARNATQRLRRSQFFLTAVVHKAEDRHITIDNNEVLASRAIMLGAAIGVLAIWVAYLLHVQTAYITGISVAGVWRWLLLLAPPLVGAIIGWAATRLFDTGISNSLIARYGRWLAQGESLVIVQSKSRHMERALSIMRSTAGEPPATFVVRPIPTRESTKKGDGSPRRTLRPEPLSTERLMQRARRLAALQKVGYLKTSHRAVAPPKDPSNTHVQSLATNTGVVADEPPERGKTLIRRLRDCERDILEVRDRLAQAARLGQGISISAEWLLDNSYVVQGQIRDIKDNLPRRYHTELPVLLEGEFTGSPRIYGLAWDLVQNSDAHLDRATLREFLNVFQEGAPLTIGELWAIPLMLRLALIEALRQLAVRIDERQHEREDADFWANRLLLAAADTGDSERPDQLLAMMADLARERPDPSPHFAERVTSQLQGEGSALVVAVQGWLERKLGAPLPESVRREQGREAAEQMTVANVITSLRRLLDWDWREIFEEISLVHRMLGDDPAAIYASMDFTSRDRYRQALEQIAYTSQRAELEIAELCLAIARQAQSQRAADSSVTVAGHHPSYESHIGYYLIDNGREQLERQVAARPTRAECARRWARKHGTPVYLGAIGLSTASTVALVLLPAARGALGTWSIVLIAVCALLPASNVAIQLIEYAVTRLLPPHGLPRMSYRTGIPDNCKTLVVVPMMLLTESAIRDEVQRLEVRYLANSQEGLQYALISDYADSPQATMPEDESLLAAALAGIEELNRRYGDDKFFLFHRDRTWCEAQECWMGWERKRGKLQELNVLLVSLGGAPDSAAETSSGSSTPADTSTYGPGLKLRCGQARALHGMSFVITLDSDTQLPHDEGRHLIETIAHPLNRAQLTEGPSGKVERGFGIIQPRVSTALPSAVATRFSRLFADARGSDPYTHLVSDVHQDLVGEGSYHGKGIYDLHLFHHVLTDRFPDSTLLSHDLIEGAHVRVGLATNIELFDQFPANYLSYAKRQHRWIRGDWQISAWIGGRVPTPQSDSSANILSGVNRWKIFDNLRRSLVPVASMLLLIASWFYGGPTAVAGSLLVALTLVLPCCLGLVTWLTTNPFKQKFPWRDVALSLGRAAMEAALLPHQAALAIDAIFRTLYRRTISHRKLLEWTSSQVVDRSARDEESRFVWRLSLSIPFATALLVLLTVRATLARSVDGFLWCALPFLVLWVASPLLVGWLSLGERRRAAAGVTAVDRQWLRGVARQTWRYFDDFVGPETHWLPPDNYQEFLNLSIAQRTSPTNIGLWMLSALAAHDFGYITPDQAIERVAATVETLESLEKHEGHLVNWIDIETTQPLQPRYLSTVDSGNLVVSLWTFTQGCAQLLDQPLLGVAALAGLHDTLHVLTTRYTQQSLTHGARLATNTLTPLFLVPGGASLGSQSLDLGEIIRRLRAARQPARELTQALAAAADADIIDSAEQVEATERVYWARAIESQLDAWNAVIDRYLPWATHLLEIDGRPTDTTISSLVRTALLSAPSLRTLAQGEANALAAFCRTSNETTAVARAGGASTTQAIGPPKVSVPDATRAVLSQPSTAQWMAQLNEHVSRARWLAGEMLTQGEALMAATETLAAATNMAFLYDSERKLFSIGYNINEHRLDGSNYDLLASECRLASFAAIADGQVPVDHWLAMRRLFGATGASWYGTTGPAHTALLSWSGTMFEYLMPLLLTHNFENSLLAWACQAAIARQIEYGKQLGTAWGVSEAAFSALDANRTYQYQAFGVPGLGVKRGLDDDLVVAPYASALALTLAPAAALRNLRRLERMGLRAGFGFYESIDYTRQRLTGRERGVIVRTFMVHHQGMSLLAYDNLLHENIMCTRFHADPRVKATEPLLYETIPSSPPLLEPSPSEKRAPKISAMATAPLAEHVSTPDTPAPRAHLLSNGDYAVMITAAGGGYSRWGEFDITRWHSDTTQDCWGSFIYARDRDENWLWSAAFQPLLRPERRYAVNFAADRATFRRRDAEIETVTEIIVAPEADAEIRRVTLSNFSRRPRRVELTSYIELALAPHTSDRAHPAFSKLFVQTEALTAPRALVAWRRPRSPQDKPIWAAHCAIGGDSSERFEFETDRAQFVGRGRSARDPAGVQATLSCSQGAVLDPIFSIRRHVTLEPGQKVEVSFITAVADSRDVALRILERYVDAPAVERAFELAWLHAQLEMHHLRIEPEDGQNFQQLASHMLYPNHRFRAPSNRLAANTLGQSRLWAHGISGDLPIFLVTIGSTSNMRVIEQVLAAHTYWRERGYKTDLVILCEEAGGYLQPLMYDLTRLVQAHSQTTGIDRPGGVFLRAAEKIAPEEITLLMSVARVLLVAARGGIAQQLGAPLEVPRLPPRFVAGRHWNEEPSAPLPFMELSYFNGLGGFTADGREYAIYLGPNDTTPAPWINVLANPDFGCLVSEVGQGYSWCGNSQSNRLTPWSNDPVVDPAGEAIYIRDEESGAFWTPTPSPIRELDAYRARHGQGYTVFEHNSHAIEQELTVFVPVDEKPAGEPADAEPKASPPLRVQRLRLRNKSSRSRRLSATCFAEWILGTVHEETQMHVITSWNAEQSVLFARNPYSPDFAGKVAFAAMYVNPSASGLSVNAAAASFTADRTEFLGRNGSQSKPAAMLRQNLSGRAGSGLDPCAALQIKIELDRDAEVEIIFLLGEAANEDAALGLVQRYRDRETVENSLAATCAWWDNLLTTVQVTTPDLSVNFLLNRWLLYQVLCCRVWARSAFYQSGGAYGFRDQLQDVMALVYAAPRMAREQILRAAAHQFVEGDVLHWWHPPVGAGVRTRFSDDLLWLPYVVSHYLKTTGDYAILDEDIPFIEAAVLEPEEHESYMQPQPSSQSASLFEHCRRSLEKGLTAGAHGLPLIGIGDWNDGMSRVGVGGKGESVWLAWFLIQVLNDFGAMCEKRGDSGGAAVRRQQATKLAATIECEAWDGDWYLRAFFDDGTPLGSHTSSEARIDSIAQSWGILSGAADPQRAHRAMNEVESQLVREKDEMILLFTPPFDKSAQDPGYIKGYVPGVRENGGQYTHAAIWVAQAFARRHGDVNQLSDSGENGDGGEAAAGKSYGDRAVELLLMLNPIEHARTPEDTMRYKVEPYVVAADVYALPGREGQGGWTWYTGSASWMYRVWLEDVLGLKVGVSGDGNTTLKIDPNIASDWPEYSMRYRHRSTTYEIVVLNPHHKSHGLAWLELDGARLDPKKGIDLVDDHALHHLKAQIGGA